MLRGRIADLHRSVRFADDPTPFQRFLIENRNAGKCREDCDLYAVRCGLFARFIRLDRHGDGRRTRRLCGELPIFIHGYDVGRA